MSRDSPEWRVQRYNFYFKSPNMLYLTVYQQNTSLARFLLVLALLLANSILNVFVSHTQKASFKLWRENEG